MSNREPFGPDVYIISLDASTGAHRWSRSFGASTDDALIFDGTYGAAVDSFGRVAIAGILLGAASAGGESLSHSGQSDAFAAAYGP